MRSFLWCPRRRYLRFKERISSLIGRRHATLNHLGVTNDVLFHVNGYPLRIARRLEYNGFPPSAAAIRHRGELILAPTVLLSRLYSEFFSTAIQSGSRSKAVREDRAADCPLNLPSHPTGPFRW